MRVDLALQQGQLHRAELILLLPVELHLLLQVLRHVLKTAAERLQRLILGHDRLPRGKIAPADRLRALAQSVDRLRDAAAVSAAVSEQELSSWSQIYCSQSTKGDTQ